jgi:pyrroloquinoline-quinone synthase
MLDRLDAIIEAHKYSKHPFVQEVLAGNVTREGVKNWAIQKYFQVYGQNRGFSGIHSNAPYEDVRQFQIEQLIAEETGIEEGTDTHYGLMKRFAFSMGATEEDFNIEPGAAVKAHVDHMINTCCKEHFVYGMLAFYTIESQTPEAVLKLAEAFKQQFGSSEEDLEWFYVHGGADVEHSEIAKYLINKYASEAPHYEVKAPLLVEMGCKIWENLQDHYYATMTGKGLVSAK